MLCCGGHALWTLGKIVEHTVTEDAGVDLKARTVVTRHSDNKGGRDELVPIHPVVVDQLKIVITDHELVFRWSHNEKELWEEFGRIQREAGIHLTCRENHRHTPPCHVYGFHDFRRAFATENADRMNPEALQKLMRHKAYHTTLGYVDMAEQVTDAIDKLNIPGFLVLAPAG